MGPSASTAGSRDERSSPYVTEAVLTQTQKPWLLSPDEDQVAVVPNGWGSVTARWLHHSDGGRPLVAGPPLGIRC